MAEVVFRVLGPVEAVRDGVPVGIGGDKAGRLLAGLLLAANRFVPTSRLVDLLWDDDPPEHARAALHNRIMLLRRRYGGELIETGDGAYRLRVTADRLDLLRFRELVADAEALRRRGDREAELGILGEALALWRGRPLANVHSEALEHDEVPRLVEEALAARERRAVLSLELGRYDEALREATEVLRAHPLHERATGHLMLALYRTGRQADALLAYEALRTELREQLGVDPGAELEQLYLDIMRADLPEEPPDAHGDTAAVPHRLPAAPGRLHGREAELRDLDEWLAAGGGDRSSNLVALVGPGGVGKTALAVHWAHRLRDRYPDGELYLNLRGFDAADRPLSVAEALDALLRALDVDRASIPDDEEEQAAAYRAAVAGRRMVVLLDNARDTAQVRPLIAGASCLTLAVSRNQLRGLVARDAAHRVTVGPLDAEAAGALVRDATGELAAPVVAEFTERCAGLPLALGIVAERLAREGGDPAGLVDELRDQQTYLDALDTGDDEGTSMRAVLSWSYQALDPAVARAYRLLGMQPAPDLGVAAVAILLDESPAATRRLLDRLVGVHLLEQPRHDRYQFHDLLRVDAAERAHQAGDDEAPVRRLLDWYLNAAIAARYALYPPRNPLIDEALSGLGSAGRDHSFRDTPAALEWFETEHAAIEAMARHAEGCGLDDRTWLFAYARWDYYNRRSLWRQWLADHERGLAAARRSGSLVGESYMLNGLGSGHGRLRHEEAAERYFLDTIRVAEQCGNTSIAVAARGNLVAIYDTLGQVERAVELGSETLALVESLGDVFGVIDNTITLGQALTDLGRHEEALEHLTRGHELAREHRVTRHLDVLVHMIGLVHANLGDHERAIGYFDESMTMSLELGRQHVTAYNHFRTGTSRRALGDRVAARARWVTALAILRELGAPEVPQVAALLAELDAELDAEEGAASGAPTETERDASGEAAPNAEG